jgi:glycerate-2-kinase
MHGLATLLGIQLSSKLQPNRALLACGESQVVVRHPGKGGRNQDLALAALEHLPKNSAIISAASDGKDNIPVAGGIVDSEYAKTKAHQLGLHAAHAVAYNQSYETLKKINGIFTINRVCANVSDFVVAIQKETTK